MADLQLKWQKSFKVDSHHVDANRCLTLPSLCHYFQEVAYEHAENLNFGYHFLKSIKKFWVLSRLRVDVYQYPLWGDEIIIVTWPRGMDGMFALREFMVKSAHGVLIAAATPSWLVLDEERHYPQRIDPENMVNFSKITESVFDTVAQKLSSVAGIQEKESFTVKFSDVDVNRHVNNGRYIQWVVDALPLTVLLNSMISSLTINFLGEASFADSLTLLISDDSSSVYNASIVNNSRNKELIRVELHTSAKEAN